MMDDDDEIHSPITASPSPSPPHPPPPPPNGRITVNLPSNVAAVTSPPANNSMALTVPPQLPRTAGGGNGGGGRSGGGGGGGREDCWSEGATGVLIDAWGERYLELSRGNLKQKHWKEVAEIVSGREDYTKAAKTDIQCKNRIDTVKKKYKLEKAKIVAGGGPSKWGFFERLDNLIGPTAKIPPVVSGGGGGAAAGSSGDGGRALSLLSKVPLGIPTGMRSTKYFPYRGSGGSNDNDSNKRGRNLNQNQNARMQFRKRVQGEMESDEEEDEDVEGEGYSDDSLPPVEKRPRRGVGVVERVGLSDQKRGGKGRKGWGSSVRMLTQAILKFGEAYEQAESAKLQQVMEMEKTRMKFARELELQRMQFFMKTQLEISQLRHGRRGGNTGHHPHHHHLHNHHTDNNINSNSNNSFSDN